MCESGAALFLPEFSTLSSTNLKVSSEPKLCVAARRWSDCEKRVVSGSSSFARWLVYWRFVSRSTCQLTSVFATARVSFVVSFSASCMKLWIFRPGVPE